MTAVTVFCVAAVLLVLAAIGLHNLQSWLERWDRDRHFEED
jgi:hypothetical protein